MEYLSKIRAQLCIRFNSEFLVTDKWLNRALRSGFSERENTRWFGIYVCGLHHRSSHGSAIMFGFQRIKGQMFTVAWYYFVNTGCSDQCFNVLW